MSILISTGNINQQYVTIDAIFAMDSHKQGFLKGTDPDKAFEGVKQRLREKCHEIGGNAVINCQFEYRIAIAEGTFSSKQAIEIFAYGTAVIM